MDVRVLELLASRICHDIISPVGAVNNGIEFLEETGSDGLDDALSLIKFSASQAGAKLQVFRYAYGSGGADPNIKPEDIQKAFSALIAGDGKVTQSWDPYSIKSSEYAGFCKILMGALMLAHEFLPKGGNIIVREEKAGQAEVLAMSPDAVVRPGVIEALNGEVAYENLDPKLVHPFALGLMADKHGFTLSVGEKADNQIVIRILAKTV